MIFGTKSLSTNSIIFPVYSSVASTIAMRDYNRIALTLQNTSTVAVLCGLVTVPESTSYNFILNADTIVRSGNGGNVELTRWKGYVYAITETTGIAYIAVTEEIEDE